MIPDISIETYGIKRLLDEIEDLGGPVAGEILRGRSGLLARVCVDRTQPVVDETGNAISEESQSFSGTNVAARKMGENAVIRDIGRVYASIAAVCREIREKHGQPASKGFYAAMQNGEFGKAERMLTSFNVSSARTAGAWDGGARHRSMRGNRGRINKGTKPMVTPRAESVKDYVNKVKRMVFYTKSGWPNAAKQIQGAEGLGKIPQSVRKHNGPGIGTDGTRSGRDPFVQLTNGVPWINKVFGGRQQSKALQGFDKIIGKDLLARVRVLRQKHARVLAA